MVSAVAVGLTRVKPGLPETGLTPLLSRGLCVCGLKIFWPFPHVRVTERGLLANSWDLRCVLLPLSVCLSFTCASAENVLFFSFIWWKTSICRRSDLRTLCVNLLSLFFIWVSVHKTCCCTPFLRKLKLRSWRLLDWHLIHWLCYKKNFLQPSKLTDEQPAMCVAAVLLQTFIFLNLLFF